MIVYSSGRNAPRAAASSSELPRRLAGATRHGGPSGWSKWNDRDLANLMAPAARPEVARRGGATALSGGDATATVHVATRRLKGLTSARISNGGALGTHHDDPEAEELPELSRRRGAEAAGMASPRGAQPGEGDEE